MNCLNDGVVVRFAGQQRSAEGDAVEAFPESQGIFLHQVIFDTVDYMGRLDNYISKAFGGQPFHGLCHIIEFLHDPSAEVLP